MTTQILLKKSASKCNKDLMSFLHTNVNIIKKRLGGKKSKNFVDYYNKSIHSKKKIKSLPVLVLSNKLIYGKRAIQKYFLVENEGSNKIATGNNGTDLQNFWKEEMYSKKDNSLDEDDVMEDVRRRALDQTLSRNEQKKPKRKEPEYPEPVPRSENIKLENIQSENIADMVDDPMMAKFWENQECTPGC